MKQIINFKVLLLVVAYCCLAENSFGQLKGLKDKISAMKPASTVEGILGMTPDDIKKMREDSASNVLDDELVKIKGHEDPLNIIGVYILKYPIKITSGSKGTFFVKKVLLDFDQEKKKIYMITSYALKKITEKFEIKETNKDVVGRGTRTTVKLGSLFYTGGGQGYYADYQVIAAGFTLNGMGKYVYEKQIPCKVSGLMEIDPGIFYIHSAMDVDVCPKDNFDKEKVASLSKQDNLMFNYMTKKENAAQLNNYNLKPKDLIDKICTLAGKFNDLAAQDDGGFTLPAPGAAASAEMFKPFSTDILLKLDNALKGKGHKHFKPLYFFCFQRNPVFSSVTEDRVINGPIGPVKTKIYIGRMVQYIVVCENLNTNPERENNFNDKAKYCYFLVNMVEYVKDREINRTTEVTDNNGFTGKYELLTHSMPFFLSSDENAKVEKARK